MKILGNRILIRHEFKNKSDGGLHLPDQAHIQAFGSRVVMVGTHPDIPAEIKPGMQVVVRPYAGSTFELNGEELKMIPWQEIEAVVEEVTEPVLSIVGAD
jgi:co-chaperonin GroES (HSP10)